MSIIAQNDPGLQEVELPEGPVFDYHIMEFKVWHNGEIVAYARDHSQAWRSYGEILHYEAEYVRRLLAEQVAQ